jgi:thiamine kinase-like enzyme
MLEADAEKLAASLAYWSDPVSPEPLAGGITNRNYLVRHRGERFVVRVGGDIPVHHVTRANELAASQAAASAGLSPAVVHHEPGALVLQFIEGTTLTPADIRSRPMLARVLALVRRCHTEVEQYLRGPIQMFWVFYVLRDYAATLRAGRSRFVAEVPRFLTAASELRAAIGPIEIAFSHNDLLAANFIDDGKRLWLIDWDYAGFNCALFDLANLCSNNEVGPAEEEWLLETYFEQPLSEDFLRRYQAAKCASLLREGMWGMVSDMHSSLDIDYAAYARDYLERFELAFTDFKRA